MKQPLNSKLIAAKAETIDEQSDGIVVSFASAWRQPLLKKKFKAVIRKRIPKTIKPRWLYFHINSPLGAICARSEILSILELSPTQARARAQEFALSAKAVDDYVSDDISIGCYELGQITTAIRDLTSEELNQHMTYHPPQSCLILSLTAKQLIDGLAGFSNTKEKKQGDNKST